MPFWINSLTISKTLRLLLLLGNFWVSSCLHSASLENRSLETGKVFDRNFAKKDHSLFFHLKPFQILILGAQKPEALFHLVVILQTPTPHAHEALEKKLPQIYSALFEDLYGIAPFFWQTGYTPTLMSLRKRILRLIRRHVSANFVEDVLVERGFVKPLSI